MSDDERRRPGHRREPAEPREVVSHLSDVRPSPRDEGPAEDDQPAAPQQAPDEPVAERPGRLEDAQAAAGDLTRMGIDPRSLGLDAPVSRTARAEPRRPPGSDAVADLAPLDDERDDVRTGAVVPLPHGRGRGGSSPTRSGPDRAEPGSSVTAPVSRPETTGPPTRPAPSPDPTPAPARSDPLRMLRTAARGLATPDAAASVQQERDLVEAVRRRQTERRLVAFVSGKGGVGCTAVAAGVGTTLMAMRDDRAVVVDVQQGTPSLGRWLRASSPHSVVELASRREDFAAPQAPSGLGVVDGPGWDHSIGRAEVAGVLERLGVDHTFHLLDVGDDTGDAGHTALARADLVVLVGAPGPAGAEAAADALDRVRYVNPQAAGRVVGVLVQSHEAPGRGSRRGFGREPRPVPASGFAGIVVPPEPSLQSGAGFDPAALQPATREAYLRVAAAVVTGGDPR